METIEHAANITLVARLLGREHLLSRAEVKRLQDLRGHYGIAAPAPICADDVSGSGETCQVVFAPESSNRLVPDPVRLPPASADGDIRLTYAQLTALIEDAVKAITKD